VLDDIQPFRALAQEGTDLLSDSTHVFQAPTAYLMEQGTHMGAHTGGQAVFEGENEPDGAMLTYSVVKPDTSEVEDVPEEVTIHVTNAEDDTIRTIKGPADDGLNRTTWGLRRKGVRGPDTPADEMEEDEQPAGPSVTPGTYTAHVTYRGHSDSTSVQVRPDPRTDGVTPEEREARQAMYDRLMNRIETATEAADRLRRAKTTIEQVNSQLEGREDSVAAQAREKGTAMADSVDALLHEIVPKDYEGIRSDPTIVNARLGQVELYLGTFYLGTQDRGPDKTERIALERAEQRLRVALDEINAFFDTEWPEYRQAVEQADPSFFEEQAPIRMEE
jgi:broad specificity phosphatase PhoE